MIKMFKVSTVSLILLLCQDQSLVLFCAAVPTGTRCSPVKGREAETCVCQTDKGVIDLTPIATTDGTPRFSGLRDGNNYIYSYNPCTTYSTTLCTNVHACQMSDTDPSETYSIADGGTEEMWIDTDGTTYLFYTGPPNKARETKVFLECDESAKEPVATTVGDTPPRELLHYHIASSPGSTCNIEKLGAVWGIWAMGFDTSLGGGGRQGCEFNITAAVACPRAAGSNSVAGVVGFVLMLLLLVGFAAYFVIGALIMKFYYKASGSDIIPNKSFWLQFPLLIRDGFLFTFGPCVNFIRDKRRSAQGYQKA